MNDMKKVLIVAISVVLVIAIAAGVSIGVMANTMNGLKDRVEELDQAYASDKAAMMAEIEAAKAANENLVTAADFEAKLAAALGEQNQTMQALISTAVKNQIEELGTEGLTEAQVQEIIDAAVANCLTEADIDAIIADANTGLTKDEVKKIVADYTAGTLTYGQIANMIDDADYDLRAFLEAKIKAVADAVEALGGDVKDLEGNLDNFKDAMTWDGEESKAPETADETTIKITSAAELAWLAEEVNGGNTFAGKTVILTADINLNGKEWTPIGNGTNKFSGTFDGNNKKISNFVVDNESFAGLFGCASPSALIKKVVIENADITTKHYAGAVVGYIYGSIENCTVLNSSIVADLDKNNDNGDKVGGIVGYVGEGSYHVTGCTVKNTTVKAFRDLGGVIGCLQKGNTQSDNLAIGCTIEYTSVGETAKDGKTNSNKGAIVGRVEVSGVTTVTLSAGTTKIDPSVVSGKKYSFVGTGKDTVIDCTTAQGLNNADLYFENLTIQGIDSNYKGYQHTSSVTYTNCTINSKITLYADTVVFKNCTFNLTGDYIWTYGADNVLFENCIFNNANSKAILVYQESDTEVCNVTLVGCTFKADAKAYTGAGDWTAAVEIDSSLAPACVIIDNCTFDSNYNGIVRHKSGSNATIYVDGEAK